MKHISFIFIAAVLAFQANAGQVVTPPSNVTAADTSTNIPAPYFKLKDLNGKMVSLSDYKGKILVIDFWATWCGPCKQAFPAMKLLVEKYKDDPKVKFLFIDTKERTDNYEKQVKDFMTQNNYPFHVVFDTKDEKGVMSTVFAKYKMPGIPAKFIIDGNGIIRYSALGYNPSKTDEETAKELENELAKLK